MYSVGAASRSEELLNSPEVEASFDSFAIED
jgi:hypothetical protein